MAWQRDFDRREGPRVAALGLFRAGRVGKTQNKSLWSR
jgi:hypothetical protein